MTELDNFPTGRVRLRCDSIMATDKDDTNSKLDGIAEHMKRVHDGVDEMRESHKTLAARLDALEKAREQDDKARKDRVRRDGEGDAEYNSRMAAMDAALPREGESETEREDRIRRDRIDRAYRDAEVALGKDRAKFAEAQMRADRAFQAWGKQAPPALHGERLRDYQVRLLTPHKSHSRTYKDSALELIADDSAFNVVFDTIVNDSIAASSEPGPAGEPVRAITSINENGHRVTRFIGDSAACWAPFMGHAVRVGRFNAELAHASRIKQVS